MLDNHIVKKIEDYCITEPRSIHELSKHIGKNWRTLDRYVNEIKKEYGTLDIKTFRGGTRGALKIVYYSAVEKFSGTVFQQELEKQIFSGREKEDFSPFDIYQFVSDKEKEIWMKQAENESKAGRLIEFQKLLDSAKKQVLFYSGNLSFIGFDDGEINVFNEMEKLVKRGISIKVLCRVDVVGINNIRKMLSLNKKYGKELIEIRHRNQPLRITIIDDNIVNMKEVKEPTCRDDELQERIFIFYTIRNREWAKWLQSIFWRMFNTAIGSSKRIEEIDRLNYHY